MGHVQIRQQLLHEAHSRVTLTQKTKHSEKEIPPTRNLLYLQSAPVCSFSLNHPAQPRGGRGESASTQRLGDEMGVTMSERDRQMVEIDREQSVAFLSPTISIASGEIPTTAPTPSATHTHTHTRTHTHKHTHTCFKLACLESDLNISYF